MIGLLGTHDDWMLRTREDDRTHTWILATDAFTTIGSYSPDAEALQSAIAAARGAHYERRRRVAVRLFFDAVPASHRAWLERLRVSFHSADCFCSHGGADPGVADLWLQAVVPGDRWTHDRDRHHRPWRPHRGAVAAGRRLSKRPPHGSGP